MEDLATRFADLLESTAARVRSMTVDRVSRGVKIAALAFPALMLGVLAVVFLFMTIHQSLAIPLGSWAAFAIEAGLFALGAALLWRKRTQDPQTRGPEEGA